MTSEHADLLNALDEMQQSPAYAVRRSVLAQAEKLIASQEQEILRLRRRDEAVKALLEVCRAIADQPRPKPEGFKDRWWHGDLSIAIAALSQ